jgi:hypothetical protein
MDGRRETRNLSGFKKRPEARADGRGKSDMPKKTDSTKSTVANGKSAFKPAAKGIAAQPSVSASVPALKKPAAKKAAPKKTAPVSTDEIALLAYFISEKRRKAGIPGDEHQDWIEAERQLRTGGAEKKSAPKSRKTVAS